MKQILHKKSIIKKTIQVGGFTLISRVFGIVRELLMVRYLGVSGASDAFFTAFKIPNSLRKVFAEGALSATFIPTFVQLVRQKEYMSASRLMTLSFLFFEGIVLMLCALIIAQPVRVLTLIAPGFSPTHIMYAVPYLQILMPFIFFISSSALLAGALQAVHRFTIPAFSPVFLNIFFIICLLACIYYQLPVTWLCWGILFAGATQCIFHLIAYIQLDFSVAWMNRETYRHFRSILFRFFPCLFSMSIVEIGLFIDTTFASYLPDGTISLLYYANRFMGIPLGVFGVAFSTVLLPHFAHVSSYAPTRLHFYILEGAKLIWWVMIPVTFLMVYFAHDIFYTLFLSEKFSLVHVQQAAYLLQIQVLGLFFFSFNKIIMNIFYALHDTRWPMLISMITTSINIGGNILIMRHFGASGLIVSTTIATIIQTIISIYILHEIYRFKIYLGQFFVFVIRYFLQLTIFGTLFVLMFLGIRMVIMIFFGHPYDIFFLQQFGFWTWTGLLTACLLYGLYRTRRFFRVQLYFLGR